MFYPLFNFRNSLIASDYACFLSRFLSCGCGFRMPGWVLGGVARMLPAGALEGGRGGSAKRPGAMEVHSLARAKFLRKGRL